MAQTLSAIIPNISRRGVELLISGQTYKWRSYKQLFGGTKFRFVNSRAWPCVFLSF